MRILTNYFFAFLVSLILIDETNNFLLGNLFVFKLRIWVIFILGFYFLLKNIVYLNADLLFFTFALLLAFLIDFFVLLLGFESQRLFFLELISVSFILSNLIKPQLFIPFVNLLLIQIVLYYIYLYSIDAQLRAFSFLASPTITLYFPIFFLLFISNRFNKSIVSQVSIFRHVLFPGFLTMSLKSLIIYLSLYFYNLKFHRMLFFALIFSLPIVVFRFDDLILSLSERLAYFSSGMSHSGFKMYYTHPQIFYFLAAFFILSVFFIKRKFHIFTLLVLFVLFVTEAVWHLHVGLSAFLFLILSSINIRKKRIAYERTA